MNSLGFCILRKTSGSLKPVRIAFILALCTGLGFTLSSCDTLDPAEDIPVYFNIQKIDLSVDPVNDGSASRKITDAWFYVDGDFAGIYELPCTFPILKKGEHDIIIKPGIKMNGISASRGYYPFYKDYEVHMNLEPDSTYQLKPTVSYYADKVQYNEDFEIAGISLEKYGNSDTTVDILHDAYYFEGNYGQIYLNSSHDNALIITSAAYNLPKIGTPVFLELDYMNNNSFMVGLYANNSGQLSQKQVMVINRSDVWNKIYINLTSICTSEQNASNFRLYFEVIKDAGVENAIIRLDNIKLVYN